MKRRTFIKTGLSSGIFLTGVGVQRAIQTRTLPPTQSDRERMLRRLARTYGGEFGEVVMKEDHPGHC